MIDATQAPPRTNKEKVRAALSQGPKSALKIALVSGVKIESVNTILEEFRREGVATPQSGWYWRATQNTHS